MRKFFTLPACRRLTKTTVLAMKMTAFLLFLGFLHVSGKGFTQTVTLSLKNAPIEKVFKEIKKQTGYEFLYTDEMLQKTNPVTVEIKNENLLAVLDECFKNQPIGYSIIDKTIVVKPKEKDGPNLGNLFPLPPIDVHGRVVNEKGEPVAGVNVKVKGTKNANSTNDNGEFTITGADENATLIFTSVNMEQFEIKINGKTNLVINLKTKVTALADVVINKGYYSTTRRLNTGSVSKITAEQISHQPVNNVLAALEGSIPGVFVSQNTGAPGGAFSVQIRGRNSIVSGNNPLYIIDGVPFTSTPLGSSISVITQNGSPLASLNPSDIESVEILKDADATAIYGSRGANGVVLITTKKGKAGLTKIDLNFYTGIGKVTRKIKLLDTKQYLAMRHEAFANDGATPQPWDNDVNGVWDTTRYTDWQKELLGGTAQLTNGQFTVSGGNHTTQFLVGGTFSRETTVLPADFNDKKISLHFNITSTSLNQKFKAAVSGNYINDNNSLSRTDPTIDAITMAPDAPAVYDSSGRLNWENDFFNPFGPLKETYNLNTDNVIGNALLQYELLPGLKIESSFGYTKITGTELSTAPLTSSSPIFGYTSGSSYFGHSQSSTWIIEPQLEYQKTFGKGKFAMLGGATLQEDNKDAYLLRADGFLDDQLLSNIGAATTITKQTAAATDNYNLRYKYNAIFARINYNWQDKYIINLTARRDGSSRFGPGRQFANFGATGIAWIFSQEKFIQSKLPFISYGKLRGSFGTTGNDQIPDYGYLSTYRNTTYPYGGSAGLYPVRLFNPDFGWELNKKIEAAIEIGFLHDRIYFTASYYRNRSSNQLVGLPLPGITGFTTLQANLPATVQNSGWEFELNTVNIKTKNLNWSTAFNISIPQNKLISYPGLASSSYAYAFAIGKPLNIVNKFHFTGVNSSSGLYSFEDQDRNGSIIFPADAVFLKKVGQTFYGGLTNSVTYKKWQATILFQFVKQTAYNYQEDLNMPGVSSNQPVWVLTHWQHPGDQAPIQKYSQDYGSNAYNAYSTNQFSGDGDIGDASYIRCKNVFISYTPEIKALQKIHMQALKLFVLGQNLFTITNYLGLDPETKSTITLPPLKVLTAGFQLTF